MSLTATQLAQQALNLADAVQTRLVGGKAVTSDEVIALAAAVMALAEAGIAIGSSAAVSTSVTAASEYQNTTSTTKAIATRH